MLTKTDDAGVETVTIKLKWHGMACPSCFESTTLRVTFTGTARLTGGGSEDDGNHEWGEDSPCTCGCGFTGPVRAFQWGEAGTELTFTAFDPELADPTHDDGDVTFEVQVCGMAPCPSGNGDVILASSINLEPTTWDVSVLRRVASTGVIDPIEEYEDFRTQGEASACCDRLMAKYPFAAPAWE